jgi:predicted regulator of Ras-like GTPase activity (Roadblock/LC7/MglB family)
VAASTHKGRKRKARHRNRVARANSPDPSSSDSFSAAAEVSAVPDVFLTFSQFSPVMANTATSKADQVVQNVIQDLPSLIAIAVVDVESGMALASYSNSPALNPETAAAYNTEVVRQKQKAMDALKLKNESMEDILITLTNQLHLIKLVKGGAQFIYLVVNSRDTNLAIARSVLRQHATHLD